jgi:hypothetical protein
MKTLVSTTSSGPMARLPANPPRRKRPVWFGPALKLPRVHQHFVIEMEHRRFARSCSIKQLVNRKTWKSFKYKRFDGLCSNIHNAVSPWRRDFAYCLLPCLWVLRHLEQLRLISRRVESRRSFLHSVPATTSGNLRFLPADQSLYRERAGTDALCLQKWGEDWALDG